MKYHRFTLVLLSGILFLGHFAHIAIAEVVHAYQESSDANIQWSFGNVSAPVSNIPSVSGSPDIVQTGFFVPSKGSSLVPRCEPCKPVNVPRQTIPPAPSTVNNKLNTGLTLEEYGVVNIAPTVIDSTSFIVQMSGERFPPPAEVPKEQDMTAPLADSTSERLSMPGDKKPTTNTSRQSAINRARDLGFDAYCASMSGELAGGSLESDDSLCICLTCFICGNHRHTKQRRNNSCNVLDNDFPQEDFPYEELLYEELSCNSSHEKCKAVFYVPDMMGGNTWFAGYSVGTNVPSMQFIMPTMLLTRPNVGEHFNAGVQNRIWADYRHWNRAVSMNGERRGFEQFSFGLEKQILKGNSVELRVPLLYQFASDQTAGDSAMAVELGNVSVFMKQVLWQGSRWTVSAGGGATLPTAESGRFLVNTDTARLNNGVYYLVSFLGVQWHPSKSTFGHLVMQTDMPIEKNELILGGNREKFEGQQVVRAGLQLGRWIYRVDHGKRPCRFGGFAEVNYALATKGTPELSLRNSNGNVINLSALPSGRSTLMATLGMPMVFGKLTCTNSLTLPIPGGDYPFSVGYNFSLNRQF